MVDSIGELDRQIRDELGFTAEDMNHYFLFKEQGENLLVQERRWLPPSMGGLKLKSLMDRLGAEREEHNAKTRFIIEKGREVEAPATFEGKGTPDEHLEPVGPQPVTTKNTYDLATSVKILPMLKEARPIIQDEKGVKIDGFHRLTVDKDWPTKTVQIKDELTRMMARFSLNFCRRKLTDKEKRDAMVAFHLKTGWSPKEMAERLPVSYSFIMKYLPDEYKHKDFVELGSKGGVASVASRREAKGESEEIRQLIPCEKCGVAPSEPFGNHNLCDKHVEEAKETPEFLKSLPKPSPPKRKVETHEYTPKDTWDHRAARMKISPSKMDEDVFTLAQQNKELKDMGWEVIFQKPYVLTVSDLTLKRGEEEKAFFNDHEKTHRNKRDADTEKREILMKFHPNVQAIGIDYGPNSKPTDILKKIVGAVKGEHQNV
jgi:hypothetical protein